MALSDFTGTSQYYKLPLPFIGNVLVTDGIRYLIDKDAFWLVTDSLSYLSNPKVAKHKDFLSIKFIKGTLTIEDDDCNTLIKKKYSYYGVPEDEIKMFFTDNVLMLTTEY